MDAENRKLKKGFTTGSCAAACAKAAAWMLFSGDVKKKIEIITPDGTVYSPEMIHITKDTDAVTCFVRKDSGDDPDITNHTLVGAKVSFHISGLAGEKNNIRPEYSSSADTSQNARVFIIGGEGVGIVTKPGLDQPVGAWAINHVPRKMITKEVMEVCRLFEYTGDIFVEIIVPEGKKLAEQTFNPRLGIIGGISILGTSGIIEPMSNEALIETIRAEMSVHRAAGENTVVLAFGNYGQDFLMETYGYDVDQSVKISNFVGESLEIAAELGFEKVLLLGHVGKLIKVSGGIMYTHSHSADCRMELLCTAALKAGVSREGCLSILKEITTEAGLSIIDREGLLYPTMEIVMERIMYYLDHKSAGRFQTECMMYSSEYGLLSKTANAQEVLRGTFCRSGLRSS